MRIGGLFIPWEYVLKWSLKLGESNRSIISMKNRLDLLDRPLDGLDIIEAYTYFESYAKECHQTFAHWASYPIWDAYNDYGVIIVRRKGTWSHEAAREIDFDSRRLPQFEKRESDEVVGKLIEDLFDYKAEFLTCYVSDAEYTPYSTIRSLARTSNTIRATL
ncbi:hypothetical protein CPB83DRAFT_900217 [Crepidotus variabilis]|uniref:Uncharacterized protein n=1 Tax=Crepidotus variabilis TaxID=179855 RepID=A0A9P6E3K1_9AGAR|nr:hypothetical protein CPB83DRAFT_900217 [Crepidotus variabilis]